MITPSGREVQIKYRNPVGKTYTIKEKDSLYKKYQTLDINTIIGVPLTIIVLYTPDDIIKTPPSGILNTMYTGNGQFADTKDWGVEKKWLNKSVAPIVITDINNKSFSLQDSKGKIRVLNFWFIKCAPCIQEMPLLNEIVEMYKNKAVNFIAIGTDDRNLIQEFVTQIPFNYNLVPSGKTFADSFGISAYPTHVVIDKKGIIRFIKTGITGNLKDELVNVIEKMLLEN
jgi:thiol-disulfide isomerase/thioredoxin